MMNAFAYKATLIVLPAALLVSDLFVKINAAILFSNDRGFQTETSAYSDHSANSESGKYIENKEFEEFKQRKSECSIYATNPQKYFGCMEN